MCGIAGIFDKKNKRIDADVICSMRDSIVHRGPDDEGYYVAGNIALAHRRLSIIDLSTGHQPMFTNDKRLCVVFNGEIYNYVSLRAELLKKGYSFNTQSDTEVLLHLYNEYGVECVKHLNGIFSFAIWDDKNKELYIARDHLGIKPLYYFNTADAFVFASEAKAIFKSGYVVPQSNKDAVAEYFIFRHVAGEQSLFKDIKLLRPGHYVVVNAKGVSIQQYWNPAATRHDSGLSFSATTEKLSELLYDAVKMQMVSDVPVGTFCSGGIDSSLITAMAACEAKQGINTFSVGFDEEGYDETYYAQMVSNKYKTQHHELKLKNTEFADYLPNMIWSNDEPLNYANSVHIYALSKLAKEYVTVVLTGEGADELFGGYNRYHIARYVSRVSFIPQQVRRILSSLLMLSGERRLKKLATYLGESLESVLLYNSATLDMGMINQVVDYCGKDTFVYRNALIQEMLDTNDALKQVTLIDQQTYLSSILNRQDKMSMAASIESRVPFLDYRVVEFANSMSSAYKQDGTQTKLILKKAAERYLPHEVIYRRKSGFGVPLCEWFRENVGLGELMNDTLTNETLEELGGSVNLQASLSEHKTGKKDNSEFIWTALNYVLWKKTFGIV